MPFVTIAAKTLHGNLPPFGGYKREKDAHYP
jgi:hypothetical protein